LPYRVAAFTQTGWIVAISQSPLVPWSTFPLENSMPTMSHPGTTTMLEILQNIELFEGIHDDSLRLLISSSSICRLEIHEKLTPTKNEVDYVYVILTGYVGIWLPSRFRGTSENFLAWRGPGQIIGEIRVIGDAPSEARITASEACTLLELRSDTLKDVARSAPGIFRNISRLLLKKMYQERHRLEVIQTSTSARKIAQTLLHLADERDTHIQDRLRKEHRIPIPGLVIQDEIGSYIGVKRETVNRKLTELKRRGLIAYQKSKNGSEITILDYDGLLEIACQT
jgi:CRP/FNR family cyclic AMP-dependent transcriptional regulator